MKLFSLSLPPTVLKNMYKEKSHKYKLLKVKKYRYKVKYNTLK